jgi:hypothetical protein
MDERALVLLRRKLEALNYHDALDASSAPLVARLVDDLVRTTDSYRSVKAQCARHAQEVAALNTKVRAGRIPAPPGPLMQFALSCWTSHFWGIPPDPNRTPTECWCGLGVGGGGGYRPDACNSHACPAALLYVAHVTCDGPGTPLLNSLMWSSKTVHGSPMRTASCTSS